MHVSLFPNPKTPHMGEPRILDSHYHIMIRLVVSFVAISQVCPSRGENGMTGRPGKLSQQERGP